MLPASQLKNSRGHRTEREIKLRGKYEVKVNQDRVVMTPAVRADPIAKKEWQRFLRAMKNATHKIITPADVTILERKCLMQASYYRTVSEQRGHIEMRDGLKRMLSKYDVLSDEYDKIAPRVDRLSDRIENCDKAIDKFSRHLLALEKELLTTPFSRIRKTHASTLKDQEQEKRNPSSMFGD
jgi:phage terminase small subunit